MSIATITSKGQVTIPKNIREKLRLRSGDRLDFQIEKDGTARIQPLCRRPADVFGMLSGKTRVSATLKQIDASLADAFRKGKS